MISVRNVKLLLLTKVLQISTKVLQNLRTKDLQNLRAKVLQNLRTKDLQ